MADQQTFQVPIQVHQIPESVRAALLELRQRTNDILLGWMLGAGIDNKRNWNMDLDNGIMSEVVTPSRPISDK